MSMFIALTQTKEHLENHAEAEWRQSYRIKDPTNNQLMHDLNDLAMIVRVGYPQEAKPLFAFFWMYSMNDVRTLIEFIHEALRLEAHEIIFDRYIKLFYDIDLELPQSVMKELIQYYEGQSGEKLNPRGLSRHLAHLYFDTTIDSMQEHDVPQSQLEHADMMFSTRNRSIDTHTYKISIHLITNIACSVEQCRAIVEDVRARILELDYLQDYRQLLCDAVDVQPYHHLGSLSIVGGYKTVNGIEYANRTQQKFQWCGEEEFITRTSTDSLRLNLSKYPTTQTYQYDSRAAVSPEFISIVYQHLGNIPNYNPIDWDIELATIKGHTAILRRCRPSYCDICKRQHDTDNTLLIVFNEERRTGAWKCIHARGEKSIVFYRDDIDNARLEQFSKRVQNANTADSHVQITQPSYEDTHKVIEEPPKASIIDAGSDDESDLPIDSIQSYEEIDDDLNANPLPSNPSVLNIPEHRIKSKMPATKSYIEHELVQQETITIPIRDGVDDTMDIKIDSELTEIESDPLHSKPEGIPIADRDDSDSDEEPIVEGDGYESESDQTERKSNHIFEDSRAIITATGALRYPSKDIFAI